MTIALIADIVSSRKAPSRADVQRDIEAAMRAVDALRPGAVQPWHPTVADEFQCVHGDLASALEATYLIQLALPEGVSCRFGIGAGAIAPVPSGGRSELQDGPGWWVAREAIDHVHRIADDDVPGARTWFIAHETVAAEFPAATVAVVEAYLILRDQVITSASYRARSAEFATLQGLQQQQIADRDGVSQSAISQALSRPLLRALRSGAMQISAAKPPRSATAG